MSYLEAGYNVVGLTSRSETRAREVAALRGIPRVYETIDSMLDEPRIEVVDVAVPPSAQSEVIRRVLAHPARRVRGILAQKPLAMSYPEAKSTVEACEAAGVVLQVNQNMRYDESVRGVKTLLEQGTLGVPVLATIEMRAIPHWMPWARHGRSLSTFLMSIHHLDTFRYWLGDPVRVMASSRHDPRTTGEFPHPDGINLYILEFPNDARASGWDDVWAGPVREGAAADTGIHLRIEGTEGLARGTIGWPGWPERVPSTLDYSSIGDQGEWHSPRWPEAWFPDAFAGTMAGLLHALESGEAADIPGRDNLRTIALCEAVLTSAREHRVVSFEPEDLCKNVPPGG
ncbi:MAG: Gfo/Idh/MocA family oxidoreductase [Isosphaeraceae bacterium]